MCYFCASGLFNKRPAGLGFLAPKDGKMGEDRAVTCPVSARLCSPLSQILCCEYRWRLLFHPLRREQLWMRSVVDCPGTPGIHRQVCSLRIPGLRNGSRFHWWHFGAFCSWSWHHWDLRTLFWPLLTLSLLLDAQCIPSTTKWVAAYLATSRHSNWKFPDKVRWWGNWMFTFIFWSHERSSLAPPKLL